MRPVATKQRRELTINRGHDLTADAQLGSWGDAGLGSRDLNGKKRLAGEDAEDFALGLCRERAGDSLTGSVTGDIGEVGHG